MAPRCCDKRQKAYDDYYLRQVGNGLPVFSGVRVQRGHGIGSVIGRLAKSVMPLIKSGAKAVGKQALTSGMQLAGDMFSGKNLKQAAKTRAKQAGVRLLKRAAAEFTFPPGVPAKRRKMKNTKTRNIKKHVSSAAAVKRRRPIQRRKDLFDEK